MWAGARGMCVQRFLGALNNDAHTAKDGNPLVPLHLIFGKAVDIDTLVNGCHAKHVEAPRKESHNNLVGCYLGHLSNKPFAVR
jgi:hypothetical protein